MPDLPYPPNFQAVGSANPSGWWDAADVEWFTAYGFYQAPGGAKLDEGAHVFKRMLDGTIIDVDLGEPRPPQRGQLWLSKDGGLELRSHRSATIRCVIPIPGVVAPVVGGGGEAVDRPARAQAIAATNLAKGIAARLGTIGRLVVQVGEALIKLGADYGGQG